MGVLVVGKAENIATQPSLAGAWAELGNNETDERKVQLPYLACFCDEKTCIIF